MAYSSRLKSYYEEHVIAQLMEKCGIDNRFRVPKLLKVVVSTNDKEAITNSKMMDQMLEQVMLITGQKAVVSKAKKSIAAFKLKEGTPLGCSVTLRKNMMYDFVDRFVNIALPRVKDFHGLRKSQFDGKGNYAMGIKEQIIFPEIQYDKIDKVRGMNIVFVTSAETDEHAMELLKLLNFPFVS